MIITLKQYANGGKIDVYDLVNQQANDFDNVFACCEYFAQQGKYVLITPSFTGDTLKNPNYHKIYASLMGTPYWSKCPDFCVYSAQHKNGVWYEHEGYDVKKDLTDKNKRVLTFGNMINRGMLQSERIIVEDCGVTERYIRRNIYNRIHCEKQNIKEVYMRVADGLKILYFYNDQTREIYSI